MEARELGSLLLVGALWGCTNSFLNQKEASDVEGSPHPSPPPHSPGRSGAGAAERAVRSVVSLFLNWKFALAFALNQSGSLLYYLLLGGSQLSLAVPICNASTLAFTALTSQLRGERLRGEPRLLAAGVALVVGGITLMSTAPTGAAVPS